MTDIFHGARRNLIVFRRVPPTVLLPGTPEEVPVVATVMSKRKQAPEQERKEWAGGSVNPIPAYEKARKLGAEGTSEWFNCSIDHAIGRNVQGHS